MSALRVANKQDGLSTIIQFWSKTHTLVICEIPYVVDMSSKFTEQFFLQENVFLNLRQHRGFFYFLILFRLHNIQLLAHFSTD